MASEDERERALDEVLRLWSVPIGTPLPGGSNAGPQLYVLGCLENRVTIFAQQIRALNLVAAIHERSALRGLKDRAVAVIGLGVGGCTAAVAAASLGAQVTGFDYQDAPFRNLYDASGRWLHPRIYDWPYPGWDNDKADLPFLTWKANSCPEVAKELLPQWNELTRTSQIATRFSARVTDIVARPRGHAVSTAGAAPESFDAVILAVGFGPEKQLRNHITPSYWEDSNRPKGEALVVGCGDGGLIDAIRAATAVWVQKDLHDEIADDDVQREIARLEDLFIHNQISPADLARGYDAIHCPAVERRLRNGKNKGVSVHVAATEESLLNSNAAPLHRFIIRRLLAMGIVNQIRSRVEDIKEVDKRWQVEFKSAPAQTFDAVIGRVGPEPSLDALSPAIYAAMLTKLPRRSSHRLPMNWWSRAITSPDVAPPANGHPSLPFLSAKSISRTISIGADGIAEVLVEVRELVGQGELVLAIPRGTIGTIDPDQKAIDGAESLPIQFGKSGELAAFKVAIKRPIRHLTWSYRMTNGFAINQMETRMFQRRSSQLADGWDQWAYQLPIDTDHLQMKLRFPTANACCDHRAVAETPGIISGGVDWTQLPASECGTITVTDDALVLDVDRPHRMHRHGIGYRPREPGTVLADETSELLSELVGTFRHSSRLQAREDLRDALISIIATHTSISKDSLAVGNARIMVQLWDPNNRVLTPVAGMFQPSSWASDFEYGVGVSGHSFRFQRPMAWHRGHKDRTSIIPTEARPGHLRHDWIVCVPLYKRYPGEVVGIAGVAGPPDSRWDPLINIARGHGSRRNSGRLLGQLAFDFGRACWSAFGAVVNDPDLLAQYEQSWPS